MWTRAPQSIGCLFNESASVWKRNSLEDKIGCTVRTIHLTLQNLYDTEVWTYSTESICPILLLHVTVYCKGQPCWKLREAISTRASFSWGGVYSCSRGFKLNSCMILLGFKMNWPESSEATVQINILAPHYSLWDQEHLIFYYWDSGLKYPFFMTWMCSYNNSLWENMFMSLLTYYMLIHQNWCFSVFQPSHLKSSPSC